MKLRAAFSKKKVSKSINLLPESSGKKEGVI